MKIEGLPLPRVQVDPSASPSLEGGSTETSRGEAFSRALVDAFGAASRAEGAAAEASTRMLEGTGEIHEAMIAHEKASISLRFAVQVKNRAIEAYRELLNTQV